MGQSVSARGVPWVPDGQYVCLVDLMSAVSDIDNIELGRMSGFFFIFFADGIRKCVDCFVSYDAYGAAA